MKTKIAPRDATLAVTVTIGLDLGDQKHFLCVLDHAGQVIEQRSVTTTVSPYGDASSCTAALTALEDRSYTTRNRPISFISGKGGETGTYQPL